MKRLILALGAAAMLAACATAGTKFSEADVNGLQPGMAETEVVAKLGQPNSRRSLPDGSHVVGWVYVSANGLTGKSQSRSVALSFDKDGRFLREVSRTQVGGGVG